MREKKEKGVEKRKEKGRFGGGEGRSSGKRRKGRRIG